MKIFSTLLATILVISPAVGRCEEAENKSAPHSLVDALIACVATLGYLSTTLKLANDQNPFEQNDDYAKPYSDAIASLAGEEYLKNEGARVAMSAVENEQKRLESLTDPAQLKDALSKRLEAKEQICQLLLLAPCEC